jgi:NTE family protein
VKGAALAGSLRAATQRGITFVGFGGTSAGSVVALLAAIGTPVDEIQDLVLETEFYPGSR